MHRGFLRLGILLTCVWLALVAAVVLFQHSHTNVFCQFDAATVWHSACQSFFWSWVPVGKLARLAPHVLRMVLVGALPPVIGWLLGFATAWVANGFRASAS